MLWPILEHYGWELPSPRTGWFTVKCGAHKDSHASCRVNNEVGAARCQACGFGGDIIKIIQHYEGKACDFRTALRIAEEISGKGNGGVRGARRSGHAVPRGARDKSGDSPYVPPRLRSRAT